MIDPIRLLERYGDRLDASVPPVTLDEVRGHAIDVDRHHRRVAIPAWTTAIAAGVALVLLIGGTSLLFGGAEPMAPTAETLDPGTTAVAPASGTVQVSVAGVDGPVGGDLAGVVYANGDLTALDADAVGGFWAVITSSDFSATEIIREPGPEGAGRYPYVTSEALTLDPGTYTLVLWADTSLGSFDRWIPINTDGMGLVGCRHVFEVTNGDIDVSLTPTLVPNGWTTDCTTGTITPGIDPDTAVNPITDGSDPWGLDGSPAAED